MNFDDEFSREVEELKARINELLEERKKAGNPGKSEIDAQIKEAYDELNKKLKEKAVLF